MKKVLLFLLILTSFVFEAQAQCVVGNFTYNYQDCSQIQFVDSSVARPNYNLVTWNWDFGDGATATGHTVVHTFTPGADVNVRLVVVADSSGVTCSDTVVKHLLVHALPTVYVQADPNPTCITAPAHFFGTSGHPIVSWQWDFGDGTSDTTQNPYHQYTAVGNYNVYLYMTDTNGCSNVNSQPFVEVVNDAPALSFTWSLDPAATTDDIKFYGSSPENVSKWHWDFGDGDTSNIQNPTHRFLAVGDYPVTMSIVVDGICTNAITDTVHIYPLPVPDFTTSPVCMNDTTFFIDQSTTTNGYINTWKWYFGDGDSLIVQHPGNPNVHHIYTTQTNYQVTLVAIDSAGYRRSITKTLAVKLKPAADFTFNDTCYGQPVQFTDESLLQGGAALDSWSWDFGDPVSGTSNSSSLQNPTHILSNPGTYAVQLIVGNLDGCTDTAYHEVVVDSLPFVDFSISSDTLCFGESFTFSGIGRDISLWHWDFGNGDTATFQTLKYQYPSPGTYTVTLTVTDLKGCKNSRSKEITVIALPKAAFNFTGTCIGDSTAFIDQSTSEPGYIAQWQWDFGDTASAANQSNSQNPRHLYGNVSSYAVQLIVTDNYGCADTNSRFVNIYGRPSAKFLYQQSCSPATEVDFVDQSEMGSSKSPVKSYLWSFYQNDTSHRQNPVYQFPAFDTSYQVRFMVTDTNGCSNIDTVLVKLRDSLRVDFQSRKVCLNQPTPFRSTYLPATDSIAYYTWNFNDGSPVLTTFHDTVSHIFPHPGTFTVELNAVDTNGCSDFQVHQIVIDSLPVVDFSFTSPSCDQPTFFTDASRGGGNFIQSWHWNFDDASSADNVSTSQNPSHFYGPNDSTYQVKLVVTNFNGCVDSLTQAVQRLSCLDVAFQVNTNRLCATDSVCFTDLSQLHSGQGSIIHWHWDFGDGNVMDYDAFTDPVCHVYAQSGSYQVQLVITAVVNGITFHDSFVQTVNINPGPEALFSWSNACLGGQTAFVDQSLDHGDPISSWLWSFGDTTQASNHSAVANPSHLYSGVGQYDVKLVVKNHFGCADSLIQPVVIADAPVADFAWGVACAGQPTPFYDSSVVVGTSLTQWQWNFDDPYTTNNTALVQNPEHTFDTAAFYQVQLIVTDNNLCRDTVVKAVDIHPSPVADFNILYNYRQVTGQVLLQNTSTGAGSYWWDFGDGNTSTDENPVKQYQSGDIYTIVLIATNQYLCTDTTRQVYDLTLGLYVPNSFVPGSTLDDVGIFKPKGIHLKDYHIQIFSSWGTLLWESSKLDADGIPTEGWDGTYKGQPMPAGNYIWRIQAQFIDNSFWGGADNGDGNVHPYGTLTLIR